VNNEDIQRYMKIFCINSQMA